MRLIEKITDDGNIQYFEEYETQREFVQMVKDILPLGDEWTDDDSSLYIVYNDGTTALCMYSYDMPKIRYNNIKYGIYANAGTTAYYNCTIVYNSDYGDYELLEE